MPRLNNADRQRILGLIDAGISHNEIARRYHVHRSTISRLIHRVRVTGSVSDRPRSGQPRVTSRRQDRFIRLRHLRNRFINCQETASVVIGNRGRPVHRRTVSRRLREFNIRCRRPYRGPILLRQHRVARLNWAHNHRRGYNWRSVVFSDESRFNLYHNDGRLHVYRRPGERFADAAVIQRDRFGGGSVLVWGAINHDFRSRLLIINGNMTARRYIDDVLRPELVPLLRRQRHVRVFQQDNAKAHTARITSAYLRQQGVNLLDWPSRSPDLSPIEHVWDELGRRVRRRQRPPQTLDELRTALQEEWDNIPRRYIRNVCSSMHNRVRMCIQQNGGHTRY